MRGQSGEKLFTIDFSSSYEEDEDESNSNHEVHQHTPAKTRTPATVVSKKQVRISSPTIGGLVDLSGSSDENYDDLNTAGGSHSPHTVSHKKKYQSNSNDVFTIEEPANKNFNDNPPNSPYHDHTSCKAQIIEENNNSDQNNQTLEKLPDEFQNDIQQDPLPTKIEKPMPMSPSNPQISPIVVGDEWITYLITREKKTHLNGTRIFFNFFEGSRQTYVAKCKTKKASNVYIMKGSEVHMGSTADALILIGNDGADFSLRKKVNSGDEIMTVRIVPPKTSTDTTRRMTVTFFFPCHGSPSKLVTKPPSLNHSGKIEHDFEGRTAIESIKNAVLIDKTNGAGKLFIRKTAKDAIELDAKFSHDKVSIFTVGIASFLSMVKGIK